MSYRHEETPREICERGMDVLELSSPEALKQFANEYGKVRTDRVIVPTGMPPEHWEVV